MKLADVLNNLGRMDNAVLEVAGQDEELEGLFGKLVDDVLHADELRVIR